MNHTLNVAELKAIHARILGSPGATIAKADALRLFDLLKIAVDEVVETYMALDACNDALSEAGYRFTVEQDNADRFLDHDDRMNWNELTSADGCGTGRGPLSL